MGQPNHKKRGIDVDVLIIGGGLVGASLAAALARSHLRLCVLDWADPAEAVKAPPDGRAFAISLSNKKFLDKIGLWPSLAEIVAPILDIRVSDGSSLFFLHFDHKTIGDEPMGFMVESHHLRYALSRQLCGQPNLILKAPAELKSLECDLYGARALLDDNTRINASVVVGADGLKSITRKMSGLKLVRWEYPQAAIVCAVHHELSHQYIAQERFLPPGPFAILPLPGAPLGAANQSSVVWTERKKLATSIKELDDVAFLSHLKHRFGTYLGEIKVIGPRWSYPLSLQFAESIIGKRVALVGDAAHGIHPIAGQGLNLGLRDIAALSEVLVDASRLGLDIGGHVALQRYERCRLVDNTLMIAATDSLNRLFSNDIMPLRITRDAGLALVNSMLPLKRLFMKQAMGINGHLPKLLREQKSQD